MLIAALSVLLSWERTARGQATFTSRVEMVRIDALAVQGARPIKNLTAEDFDVRDQGVPQDVQLLTTTESVNIVLVLDRSGSLLGDQLRSLMAVIERILATSRKGDGVTLVQIGQQVSVTSASGSGAESIRAALAMTTDGGATALHDAVFVALGRAAAGTGRSLIIILSDGLDNASLLTASETISAVRREECLIYGVYPPEQESWIGRNRAPGFLEDLSRSTGGTVVRADGRVDVAGAIEQVLAEFRSRYVLAYVPTGVGHDDGWHELKVTLRGRSGVVKARPGYYAGRRSTR